MNFVSTFRSFCALRYPNKADGKPHEFTDAEVTQMFDGGETPENVLHLHQYCMKSEQ
jgi:hypothetical protein